MVLHNQGTKGEGKPPAGGFTPCPPPARKMRLTIRKRKARGPGDGIQAQASERAPAFKHYLEPVFSKGWPSLARRKLPIKNRTPLAIVQAFTLSKQQGQGERRAANQGISYPPIPCSQHRTKKSQRQPRKKRPSLVIQLPFRNKNAAI